MLFGRVLEFFVCPCVIFDLSHGSQSAEFHSFPFPNNQSISSSRGGKSPSIFDLGPIHPTNIQLQSWSSPSLIWVPDPRTREEGRVHAAALKHGLALAADIHFMQIPVCGGHADDGSPILELQSWPFLQPHVLVPWIN